MFPKLALYKHSAILVSMIHYNDSVEIGHQKQRIVVMKYCTNLCAQQCLAKEQFFPQKIVDCWYHSNDPFSLHSFSSQETSPRENNWQPLYINKVWLDRHARVTRELLCWCNKCAPLNFTYLGTVRSTLGIKKILNRNLHNILEVHKLEILYNTLHKALAFFLVFWVNCCQYLAQWTVVLKEIISTFLPK